MSRPWACESESRPSAVGPVRTRSAKGRRRSSPKRRGQVEPFAALAAVLAVGIALSLYAAVLSDAAPRRSDGGTAEATLSQVHRTVGDGVVVLPERVQEAREATPPGYELNVTIAVDGERWRAGPTPPASAERASRDVGVRLGPGKVRPGRLTVVVWT